MYNRFKWAVIPMIALGLLLSGCGSSSSPTIIGKWSEVYDSSGASTSGTEHFYKSGLWTQSDGAQGAWAVKGSHRLQFTIGNTVFMVTYTIKGTDLTFTMDGTVQKFIRLS